MTPKAATRAEADRLFAAFQAAGAIPVDADILLPAETLLDLYGEDIRAKAYVTTDPVLGEMMLRPDFTVPVVQAHMAHGADPARYCYSGEVFRAQDHLGAQARESLQVGFEVFDRQAPERADAEVFALFGSLLSGLNLRAVTGDIGILMAAVRGISASDKRKAALLRHIWRPQRFRALLDRFSGRAPIAPARAACPCAVALKRRDGAAATATRFSWRKREKRVEGALPALLQPALSMSLYASVTRAVPPPPYGKW